MAGHFVGHGGHVAHSGRVDPVVVELEQRADCDRIVERFIRPPGFARAIYILLADRGRVGNHFPDEGVERAILLREWRCLDVGQNALNQIFIAQQLRRDRGV